MPFCIRTTYWSPTCLHVFFFKNLKKWQPCTHICIFCILPDNSKTTQPDLTRFHIQFLGRNSEFSIVSVFSKYGNTAQKADSKNRNFTKSRRARFFLFVCAEGAQQMLQAPQAPCIYINVTNFYTACQKNLYITLINKRCHGQITYYSKNALDSRARLCPESGAMPGGLNGEGGGVCQSTPPPPVLICVLHIYNYCNSQNSLYVDNTQYYVTRFDARLSILLNTKMCAQSRSDYFAGAKRHNIVSTVAKRLSRPFRHRFRCRFLLQLYPTAPKAQKHVYGVPKNTSREATIFQAQSACYARLAAQPLVFNKAT